MRNTHSCAAGAKYAFAAISTEEGMDQRLTAIADCLRDIGVQFLKEKQLEAIHAFLDGRDTFVSLPTGYGKSLIYGILPLLFDKGST